MIIQGTGLLHLRKHGFPFFFSSFSSLVPSIFLILSGGVGGRKSKIFGLFQETEPTYNSRVRKQIKGKQRTQPPMSQARWEGDNSSMKCQPRNLKGTEQAVGVVYEETGDGRRMEWAIWEAGKLSPAPASPRRCQ